MYLYEREYVVVALGGVQHGQVYHVPALSVPQSEVTDLLQVLHHFLAASDDGLHQGRVPLRVLHVQRTTLQTKNVLQNSVGQNWSKLEISNFSIVQLRTTFQLSSKSDTTLNQKQNNEEKLSKHRTFDSHFRLEF